MLNALQSLALALHLLRFLLDACGALTQLRLRVVELFQPSKASISLR